MGTQRSSIHVYNKPNLNTTAILFKHLHAIFTTYPIRVPNYEDIELYTIADFTAIVSVYPQALY